MMFSLIKADIYKETRKKSFKLIMLLIIFVSVLCLCILNKNISSDYELKESINSLSKEEYKSVYKYGNYQQFLNNYESYKQTVSLENRKNIFLGKSKLRNLLDYSVVFMFLLGIIPIILGYHSFSYDFTRGSVKYVFMSNKSRKSILFSKLLTILILILLFISVYDISVLITSHLLTGKSIFALRTAVFISNRFIKVSYLYFFILKTFLYVIPFMFLSMFSMFLCILFKGSSFSLIVSIVIYITSLTISESLINYGVKFIKWTFIPYLDYSYLLDKVEVMQNNLIYNMNYSYLFSSIILVIYFIVFIFLSCKLIKRDY